VKRTTLQKAGGGSKGGKKAGGVTQKRKVAEKILRSPCIARGEKRRSRTKAQRGGIRNKSGGKRRKGQKKGTWLPDKNPSRLWGRRS